LAEYNWALAEGVRYNLTKVHMPLNCAHGPGYDCNLFFDPGVDEEYTEDEINLATRMGLLKRIRVHGTASEEKMKEFVIAHPEDNIVFNFTETRTNSNYGLTRDWWRDHLSRAKNNPEWVRKFRDPNYDRKAINVALHIRRGDLMKSFGVKGKERNIKLRYTHNNFYITVLTSIKRAFPGKRVVGHFISQGEAQDFQDIVEAFPNDLVLLNGEVLDDFRFLMESDIVVTAKSGYSHLAASLSDAVVIALPFWSTYSFLPSVVHADETLEEGFNLAKFARVWNARTPRLRKHLRASFPRRYVEPTEAPTKRRRKRPQTATIARPVSTPTRRSRL